MVVRPQPKKVTDLLAKVRACVDCGRYLDTSHASMRQGERAIIRPEIIYVLKNGYHEKSRDKYDPVHRAWNYALRGKTVDSRSLRVVVSFIESDLLIITAIDLGS